MRYRLRYDLGNPPQWRVPSDEASYVTGHVLIADGGFTVT